MKKASGVALVTNEVPALLTGGGRMPLTMPPLSATMLEALLGELLDEGQRQQLSQGQPVETEYRTAQGSFTREGAGHRRQDDADRAQGRGRRRGRHPRVAPTAAPAPATAASAAISAPLARDVPATADVAVGADVAAILARAAARGASDIVLSAGAPPSVRIDGAWSALPGPRAVLRTAAGVLRTAARRAPGAVRPHRQRRPRLQHPRPGRARAIDDDPDPDGDNVRLRVNLFRHAGGVAAAVRPIWSAVPTLAALHLPPALLDLVRPGTGLVLLAGPTGAGKSTTLAALLDHLNRTRACHIVTLEDPIEYLYRQAAGHRAPARGGPRRGQLRLGPAGGAAREPRRAAGGRDARPRDHPPGADRRRDRAPGAVHAPQRQRRHGHRARAGRVHREREAVRAPAAGRSAARGGRPAAAAGGGRRPAPGAGDPDRQPRRGRPDPRGPHAHAGHPDGDRGGRGHGPAVPGAGRSGARRARVPLRRRWRQAAEATPTPFWRRWTAKRGHRLRVA